ncbi:hypothetical protein [Paenibacillus amylolyticus]|uniref:hypothetical protein n=1 Tax=Paenibacillus amylolyticus TaxID=1451 RepID=UPI00286BE8F0|nr:hypothetical protein [Paenibacillus amylolyticus]
MQMYMVVRFSLFAKHKEISIRIDLYYILSYVIRTCGTDFCQKRVSNLILEEHGYGVSQPNYACEPLSPVHDMVLAYYYWDVCHLGNEITQCR